MVRRKNARRQRVEEDPMAGTSNLVDAMLVIATVFLVFVIISWNMAAMIDPDTSVQELMQKTTTEIDKTSNWMRHRIPVTAQVRVILKWVRCIRIRQREN